MEGLSADPFRAARLLLHLRQEGVIDTAVLAAMEALDRSLFVEDGALAPLSFEDAVLPIPCGQVILRPAATGHLLQALAVPAGKSARVFVIGFGAGYLTALLAQLSAHVVAVDRFATLVREGRERFARLGISNVTIEQADGLDPSADFGPFDRIVLTGAVTDIPAGLIRSTLPEGRIAAPVVSDGRVEIVSLPGAGGRTATPFFQELPPLAAGLAAML
jgi:protein-L-isoaspartate(D-aspartate) O-methyltransferase